MDVARDLESFLAVVLLPEGGSEVMEEPGDGNVARRYAPSLSKLVKQGWMMGKQMVTTRSSADPPQIGNYPVDTSSSTGHRLKTDESNSHRKARRWQLVPEVQS